MENDCAIYRLADVYLMKAECLVRLGQDNTEATRLVNELRKRAFTDPAKLKTSVTLDDIRLERRFELAWENWGRQDMIRFGTFLNPIPGWRPKALPAFRSVISYSTNSNRCKSEFNAESRLLKKVKNGSG